MISSIRKFKRITGWLVGLTIAIAASGANAAVVFLGGTAEYEDGSSLTVDLPDGAVIVPDNSSFGFTCGALGGGSCADTVALFTTWTDAVYGDVRVIGAAVSFDVVDDVIENYTFLFRGVDALTELVRIKADDRGTCRIGVANRNACSRMIPGEPNYYVVPDVPLPAAAWLFGSALIGLGVIKRRKAA